MILLVPVSVLVLVPWKVSGLVPVLSFGVEEEGSKILPAARAVEKKTRVCDNECLFHSNNHN